MTEELRRQLIKKTIEKLQKELEEEASKTPVRNESAETQEDEKSGEHWKLEQEESCKTASPPSVRIIKKSKEKDSYAAAYVKPLTRRIKSSKSGKSLTQIRRERRLLKEAEEAAKKDMERGYVDQRRNKSRESREKPDDSIAAYKYLSKKKSAEGAKPYESRSSKNDILRNISLSRKHRGSKSARSSQKKESLVYNEKSGREKPTTNGGFLEKFVESPKKEPVAQSAEIVKLSKLLEEPEDKYFSKTEKYPGEPLLSKERNEDENKRKSKEIVEVLEGLEPPVQEIASKEEVLWKKILKEFAERLKEEEGISSPTGQSKSKRMKKSLEGLKQELEVKKRTSREETDRSKLSTEKEEKESSKKRKLASKIRSSRSNPKSAKITNSLRGSSSSRKKKKSKSEKSSSKRSDEEVLGESQEVVEAKEGSERDKSREKSKDTGLLEPKIKTSRSKSLEERSEKERDEDPKEELVGLDGREMSLSEKKSKSEKTRSASKESQKGSKADKPLSSSSSLRKESKSSESLSEKGQGCKTLLAQKQEVY
ncbi:unnamed protein product [Cylicocyclus nassatus]|uniref:Uncharacterized protein n=1 Tax=Cylicocyclus nassatus TaxID=53992 RepID=A0AA36DP73_CYLNA|nr:unnamed protein product [Cylicocyclus nassatus]